MSLNKYNSTSGELEPISQNRMWIGTEAEYSAAVSAGTIGTDMLIYITDDEEGPTDVVEKNNKYAVQSGAVYDAINTVQEQIDDMANSGTVAKNLLPTRGAGTTATSYGITFTVQSDGSVKANGTATGGQALFQCCFATPLNAGESYRLLGGKSTSKFVYANAVNVSTFVKTIGLDVNDPTSEYNRNPFTPDYVGYTIVEIGIAINQGQTCNNEVFYPMVTLASNTDGTYVPYVMSNQAITNTFGSTGTSLDNAKVAINSTMKSKIEGWITSNITSGHESLTSVSFPSSITGGPVLWGFYVNGMSEGNPYGCMYLFGYRLNSRSYAYPVVVSFMGGIYQWSI